MNTSAVVNRFEAANTAVSDRTRMFGYTGGAPGLVMDAKKSGLDCNPIVGGRLLMFVPGKEGYLGGINAKGFFQKAFVDMMPSDYASVVDRKFHTSDDFGFRLLPMLTPLPYKAWQERIAPNIKKGHYEDEAYTYFDVVHTTAEPCPYDLNKEMAQHNPEVGLGELVYQPCPTCRLASLRSDAVSERIFNASTALDSQILLKLRETLIEANEATLAHVERKSTMIISDIARTIAGQKGFRTTLNAIDRIHLKMMHKEENSQSNTQLDMVRTLAQEMASAMRANQPIQPLETEVVQATNVLSADEMAEYAELKAKRDAARSRMAAARAAKGESNASNSD